MWKKRKFWLILLLSILSIVLLATAGFAYKLQDIWHDVHYDTDTENALLPEKHKEKIIALNKKREERSQPVESEEPRYDFYTLLVGLDSRGEHFSLNTDSILVAHVMPKQQRIKLISLPRDLRVIDLDEQPAKINAIFAEGYMQARSESQKNPDLLSGELVKIGPYRVHEELLSAGMVMLRETVEEYLDIPIEHTFLVQFQTVTELVDAVGGIDVDVKRLMMWADSVDGTSIHFNPGMQHLNGQQALDYARFRRDSRGDAYNASDLERGKRQQEVISRIVDKAVSWHNLPKMMDLIEVAAQYVKTDMDQSTMMDMAKQFYNGWSDGSVETISFPGYWESPYIWMEDEELRKVKETLHALK